MCKYLYNKIKNLIVQILDNEIWEYNLYTGMRWDDY